MTGTRVMPAKDMPTLAVAYGRRMPGKPRRLVARSATTGEILAETGLPFYSLYGLTAAPDGSAVVGYRDSWLIAWRPGGKVEKARTGTLKHYRGLAFHPDVLFFLTDADDVSPDDVRMATRLNDHRTVIHAVELSASPARPDGPLHKLAAANGGTYSRLDPDE